MKKNRMIGFNLALLVLFILFSGIASADYIYDEKISEGDGYQINNYFFEVNDIFAFGEDLLVTPKMYLLKADGTYDELIFSSASGIEGKREHKYKNGDIQILVQEKNLTSKYVIVDISTSGFTVDVKKAVVGGVEMAVFVGEPSLSLTKEVDKASVEMGDVIRVTIKAKNTGNGPAKRINIDPGITPGFTFKSNIYTTYPTELAVGNTYTQMLIYEIQAATSGTITLDPATATYSSSQLDDQYTSTSNRPVVKVAEKVVETSDLTLKISSDKTKVKRGEKITFTIYVKNEKDVPATSLKIEPVIPKNFTYLSGSEDIDIINEKPIIQEGTFGAKYETEYKFTLRAEKIGNSNITVKLNYNNGARDISKNVESNTIYVKQGKYDYLAEYPWYVYLTPILIIVSIAGWLYWRANQFRM